MFGTLFFGLVLTATIGNGAGDPGSAPCAVWLKERVTGEALGMRTWALGVVQEYASALTRPSFAAFADTENILVHIDIYCEAHPSDHLDHAVQSVIGDFEELRETLEDLRKHR